MSRGRRPHCMRTSFKPDTTLAVDRSTLDIRCACLWYPLRKFLQRVKWHSRNTPVPLRTNRSVRPRWITAIVHIRHMRAGSTIFRLRVLTSAPLFFKCLCLAFVDLKRPTIEIRIGSSQKRCRRWTKQVEQKLTAKPDPWRRQAVREEARPQRRKANQVDRNRLLVK